ncbi:hypothetical protein V6N12_007542 [Hibiscus sabdariffa]|uniref:Uncharacterized protein n=1 Tax=Hibiscus sabdariffa TaxID=183260 RepID=A0ABR2F230_9ROSI
MIRHQLQGSEMHPYGDTYAHHAYIHFYKSMRCTDALVITSTRVSRKAQIISAHFYKSAGCLKPNEKYAPRDEIPSHNFRLTFKPAKEMHLLINT